MTSRFLFSDSLATFRESFRSYSRNNNSGVAASLAYYGLFALIPLFLLVIYLLGNFVLSSKAAVKALESLILQLLPRFSEVILNEVFSLSRHKDIWGPISMLALFWAVTPLVGAIRSAFFQTFNVDEQPSFFRAKLLDTIAVMVILLLFLSLVITEIFYTRLITVVLKSLPALLYFSNIAAPLIITMSCMMVFFFLFSPVRLRLEYLIMGSLITALLWAVMRPAFTLFLTFNPRFGFAFGSLKAIFIILVWVYYSFAVILFSAEVMANARKKDALLLKAVFSSGGVTGKVHRKLMEKFGKTYAAGETVFREGDEGKDMFFILSGSVDISRGGRSLRVLKEGEYFGEMSMLIHSPRTAGAVAVGPATSLIIISQDNFETILKEDTRIIVSILRELSARLKLTDESIQGAAREPVQNGGRSDIIK